MRRGWSYVCSTLAITLALLGAPLHAEFAYVTNNGDNAISGYTINPATGALSPIAGSPFLTGNHPSGQLRPVKGVLSIALEARRRHRQTLIVPAENAAEAAVVEGVEVYGASSLSEVVHFLRGDISLQAARSTNNWSDTGSAEQDLGFGKVKGQQHVKRAVEVLAAGGTISSPLDLLRPEQLRVAISERQKPIDEAHLSGTRFSSAS